jgi:hypothetical protein
MTQAMHTANGKIPLKSEYVIKALQEENYLLREQNVTLRGMFFQCQGEAQEQINTLNAQIGELQKRLDEPTSVVAAEQPTPSEAH